MFRGGYAHADKLGKHTHDNTHELSIAIYNIVHIAILTLWNYAACVMFVKLVVPMVAISQTMTRNSSHGLQCETAIRCIMATSNSSVICVWNGC